MTAVEWLEVQMFNLQIELNKEKISITKYEWIRLEIIEQAKEMEKEQIIQTWYDCKMSVIEKNPTTAEQYYNQIFKSE
jgi:hypothetical protein